MTAYLQVMVLVVLAFGLLLRWLEGNLTVYVNPAFVWLSLVSVVLLALVALPRVVALRQGEAAGQVGSHPLGWPTYLLSGLAAVLVFLLPPRPLGSAALENQGLDGGGAAQSTGASSASALDDTREWTLFEWSTVLGQTGQRDKLIGRPASVVGFVHHPKAGLLPDDQFMLARFVVRCCTADSNALALPVHWPAAAGLPSDSWVRMEGTLQVDRSGPRERPFFEATQVTPVPRPINPYLSPTG